MRKLRTSEQWWNEIKNDPERFTQWLKDQYHGEMTAVQRIGDFRRTYTVKGCPNDCVLDIIQKQEFKHATWVADLLTARGIKPAVLDKDERYWKKTLAKIDSFETGAGVAAHAEIMRLERIRAICADETAPKDVRDVFLKILPQEEFHAKAFSEMAGDFAMAMTAGAHVDGMMELGLIPV